MKKVGIALLASIFTIALASASAYTTLTSAVARESCECSAADGSCSASGTCPGKCTAQCPQSGGGCFVKCGKFEQFFETEVTFQMQNGSSRKLLAELARVTGKSISFSSKKGDVPFNLDAKRASVWDLLEVLSIHGTVTVEGVDFESLKATRYSLRNGERLSLTTHGLTAGEYVAHLAALSGLRLRIASGDPNAPVNLKFESVTLTEVLNKMSEQLGVEIVTDEDEEDDAGAR